MHPNLQKLFKISSQPSRLIVGLMSGTSFDGLDIALCKFHGCGLETALELLHFTTVPFAPEFKEDIKSVFIKETVILQKVALLNESIGSYFGEIILQTLTKWDIPADSVDLIASHGQTIFHASKVMHCIPGQPNATLQIGDGDHLAVKTNIITISDFRQKHIAAGGEGAPLAVYGDYILFSKKGENRIMLNIGGIANFTYLPSECDPTQVFSTDVGPGNTLMDQYVQKYYPGKYYDTDAELGRRGIVNEALLHTLFDHSFFELGLPKTTGPELFNLDYLDKAIIKSNQPGISNEDVLATLCKFSAVAIVKSIKKCFNEEHHPVIYLSGGGMYNPLLVEYLKQGLDFAQFATTEELGVNPDAKEAVLFALLANEAVNGKPINFGHRNGIPATCMGKISFP